MRSHILLRERIFDRPLLCTDTYANIVVSVLAERLGVEPMVSQEAISTSRRPAFDPIYDRSTGIVQYPIVGSMVHRGGDLEAASGMQSYTQLQNDLDAYSRTMGVKGILLDLDTPGGEAAGIVELAQWVQDTNDRMPIWAVANTRACSGGYWLAAACGRITAAPMASVGSIGVVTMHQDVSAALEKRGVVTTMIYAGEHKVDGNPYGALPLDVKAKIQAEVDDLYRQFVAAVADMRGLDESAVRATEAGVFSPEQALDLKLVDAIGTRAEALSQFSNFVNRSLVPGVSLETVQMEKLFTQDDLNKVRLEATEAGRVEGVKLGHAEAVKNVGAALTVIAPGNAAIETFCETLKDGGSVDLAQKVAMRVSVAMAPVAGVTTVKDVTSTVSDPKAVEAILAAASPNVKNGDDQVLTDQEKRRLEIQTNLKGFKRVA